MTSGRRPSRYPVWVRVPGWISGIAAIAAIVLVLLGVAWPLLLPDLNSGPVWAGVLVAFAVAILAWIAWAILIAASGRRR